MSLTVPHAILIGSIIIALTGLFLFRYEVSPGADASVVIRLNRLTGRISYCLPQSSQDYYCK
jgi:hypothetical protein